MRAIRRTDGSSSRNGNISMRRQLRKDGGFLVSRLLDSLVTGVTLMGILLSFERYSWQAGLPTSATGNRPWQSPACGAMTYPEQRERNGAVSLTTGRGRMH